MRRVSSQLGVQLGSVSGRFRPRSDYGGGWTSQGPTAIVPPARTTPSSVGDSPEEIERKVAVVEAILFLAREPLSSRRLSQHGNLADGTEARTLVRRLNERLDQQGRAFRVHELAGGFQLVTRRKFAKWLRRLDYVPHEERLSTPALETLAVVAYRQPVLRADIEAIRGVSCGEVLNQLLSRDLVRIGGRSEELGRPYLYNTTKRFLQLFGLRGLEDLPKAEQFRQTLVEPSVSPTPVALEQDPTKHPEVEEEPDVSVSIELEPKNLLPETNDTRPEYVGALPLRMEDEDYDDEEFEDEEEDEDDDFEDEEDEFEEEEEEEFEEEDEFEDEESEEEFEDEEEGEEEAEAEEEGEEEWEEVESEEESEEEEEEEEEWEDDDEDWEDDEEWEEEEDDEE
jgi:segregation and condensation protein B